MYVPPGAQRVYAQKAVAAARQKNSVKGKITGFTRHTSALLILDSRVLYMTFNFFSFLIYFDNKILVRAN